MIVLCLCRILVLSYLVLSCLVLCLCYGVCTGNLWGKVVVGWSCLLIGFWLSDPDPDLTLTLILTPTLTLALRVSRVRVRVRVRVGVRVTLPLILSFIKGGR
jgi:hypothetical protein